MVYSVVQSLNASTAISGQSPLAQALKVTVGGPLLGKPAPGFALPNVHSDARNISTASFKGKPLVINFFASWCVPCKTELPEFADLSRAEAGKVQFVGVDENDTSSGALSLLQKSGVHYPAAFDPSGKLEQPYHLIGLPTTVFINSRGVVVAMVAGQISSSALADYVSSIAIS